MDRCKQHTQMINALYLHDNYIYFYRLYKILYNEIIFIRGIASQVGYYLISPINPISFILFVQLKCMGTFQMDMEQGH